MFGMQRGLWRSWLACPAPSEDAQPGSVPNAAKKKRVQQHGRARTDKLIPGPGGNAVFRVSVSTFSCHFPLSGETFRCPGQLADGGRRGLSTRGCSAGEGAGEAQELRLPWGSCPACSPLSVFSLCLRHTKRKLLRTQGRVSLSRLTREVKSLSRSFSSCPASRRLKRLDVDPFISQATLALTNSL